MTPEELRVSLLELLPPNWVSDISVKSEEYGGPLFINLLNLYVVQIELDNFSRISVKLCDLYFARNGKNGDNIDTIPITMVYADKLSRLKKSLVPTMVYKIRGKVISKLEPITLSNYIACKRFIEKLIELYNPWELTILRQNYFLVIGILSDNGKEILQVNFQIKLGESYKILECILRVEVYSKVDNITSSMISIDLTDKLPNVDLMLGYSSAQLLNL